MKYSIHSLMSTVEMDKVHQASLAILEDTGMQIDHPQARSRLHDAGAKVDNDKNRVRFPAALVEKSINMIPKTVCLAGRDSRYDLMMSYDSPFIVRCGTGLTAIMDYQTGTYRNATIEDQKNLATLVDGLDNIGMAAPLTVHDVPSKTADLHATRVLLQHQRKHFMNLTMGSRNMRYQIEMQLAVRGSREDIKKRPLFHPIACLISPLHIPEDDIEIMMAAGEYGLPVKIPVMPMFGASAPITLAGTLALGNAEVLGAFTVLQTLCPGNPTLYYLVPSLMDMRTGGNVYAAPENILLYSAIIQLARSFYKVPSDTTGLFADGVLLEQSAYQKGTNLQAAAIAGANIVSGAGTVDGGMAFSPQQLAIDDEMVAFTRRLLAGFEITDKTLALDCVRRVGPKGNFLEDRHTLENFRTQALYTPSIFNYQNHSAWQQDPRQFAEKAQEKVHNILTSHEVPPLEDAVIKELQKILQAADKEIT
ncbi:MAG: trimethylamine methyltransferase family protein [Deltaproteobacteria bacterium]|nr:trimethylamine methyltransferase family protein [Deltaproteobacteria bacterium]MBW2177496.1 trimethylamine methyltransferase family protein [Deltaproteobacteria bacterium]